MEHTHRTSSVTKPTMSHMTHLNLPIHSVPSQTSHFVSHLDLVARVGQKGIVPFISDKCVLREGQQSNVIAD